jgi:hypothetical protein
MAAGAFAALQHNGGGSAAADQPSDPTGAAPGQATSAGNDGVGASAGHRLVLSALPVTGASDATTCDGEPGFSVVKEAGSGKMVQVESRIDAAQLVDGDLSTGWRCTYHPDYPPAPGLASKPREQWGYDPSKAPTGPMTAGLSIADGPQWITRVCLVPGTVRISDDGKSNRWFENGRVTQATWGFFVDGAAVDGSDLTQAITPPEWPGSAWRSTLTRHDYWYSCQDLPAPVGASTVTMTIDQYQAGAVGSLAGTAKPSEVEIWGHA